MPEAEAAFIPSDDEMDEAPSVVDMDDVSVVDRDEEEEDEPPAPKKLRREVAALQSSPPPQPVASSSKSRITPSPGKAQPLASSSKVTLSKIPVPYVAVPSNDLKVSLHCFCLFYPAADLVCLSSANATPRSRRTNHNRCLRPFRRPPRHPSRRRPIPYA
jgi:hypothetical protein